jgi:hypothetical protein
MAGVVMRIVRLLLGWGGHRTIASDVRTGLETERVGEQERKEAEAESISELVIEQQEESALSKIIEVTTGIRNILAQDLIRTTNQNALAGLARTTKEQVN